jgi:hypothetical protein
LTLLRASRGATIAFCVQLRWHRAACLALLNQARLQPCRLRIPESETRDLGMELSQLVVNADLACAGTTSVDEPAAKAPTRGQTPRKAKPEPEVRRKNRPASSHMRKTLRHVALILLCLVGTGRQTLLPR